MDNAIKKYLFDIEVSTSNYLPILKAEVNQLLNS